MTKTLQGKHKAITIGYYYACCPYCKTTLMQAMNDTDAFIKCPTCNAYIHIVIKDDTEITKRKGT